MSTGQAWAADQDDIYYNEYLPLCKKMNVESFHRFREWRQHFESLKNPPKKLGLNKVVDPDRSLGVPVCATMSFGNESVRMVIRFIADHEYKIPGMLREAADMLDAPSTEIPPNTL